MTPEELARQAVTEWAGRSDTRYPTLEVAIERVVHMAITNATLAERIVCANLCTDYANEHWSVPFGTEKINHPSNVADELAAAILARRDDAGCKGPPLLESTGLTESARKRII